MDVRVQERLVGALVLVAIVVLFVPALLTGPDRPDDAPRDESSRSVVITVDDGQAPAGNKSLVPEPTEPPAAIATVPPHEAGPPPESAGVEPTPPAATPGAAPAAPPAAATTATTPAWAVQLGAFSTRDKAEGLVADLKRRGYPAFVLEYRARGQVLHRVRVGPEQDRDRAAAIAERLRKDGFQPVVAPHP